MITLGTTLSRSLSGFASSSAGLSYWAKHTVLGSSSRHFTRARSLSLSLSLSLGDRGHTVAPAVATGSGTPADWALASSSVDHATSRALKERDFSLAFNGGTSSPRGSACFERPGTDKPSSAAAAGAWDSTARSALPISYGFSFDTTPHEAVTLGTLANPSSLNLTAQSLFSSSSRFVNTDQPNYNRQQFSISRSGNEDQFISFYGQRLAPRRDQDEASRASFVSFVGAEVQTQAAQAQAQARLQLQAGREADEEVAAVAASAGVPQSINTSSLQQPGIRRVESAGDIQANKGSAVSIVSQTAEGVQHQWPVNILSRAKPSHSEQRGESRATGRGNNEGNAENSMNVVDMDLLSSRGVVEGQTAQHQTQQLSMMQLQQHQRVLQVEPISMRQRSSSGTSIACQDCGNQAKKDCPHSRCRTCCKSRGYDCATHVKSTWVPAAKRRERQQAELAAMVSGQPVPKSKRARSLALAGAAAHLAHHHHHHHPAASYTSASTGTPPRTTSEFNAALLPMSHQQDTLFRALLPPEVKAQAVFQCVRVSSIIDGQDEYAYRTVVRIGGRIFKGLLHDQGAPERGNVPPSSVAELQLGGRSAPLSSALIDLAGIYGTPGNALVGKEPMPAPF